MYGIICNLIEDYDIKKSLLPILVLFFTVIILGCSEVDRRYCSLYGDYSTTITINMGHYHQIKHTGVLDAYASSSFSTGKSSVRYVWESPWLYVWVVNNDDKPVTINWREYYYKI